MILLKIFENNSDNSTGKYLENAGTFYILCWRKKCLYKGIASKYFKKNLSKIWLTMHKVILKIYT